MEESQLEAVPNVPGPMSWDEPVTERADPRLVLTPTPGSSAPSPDIARVVGAGIVALVVTAEVGRRLGVSPRVNLACSVAAFTAVVVPGLSSSQVPD